MSGGNTREFTAGNFEHDALGSERPVLVDFWAPWCPPCRAVGPTIDAVADETAGRAVVGKLNVDEHPSIASRYGVRSIPTMLVFVGGEVVARFVGVQDRATLVDALETRASAVGG